MCWDSHLKQSLPQLGVSDTVKGLGIIDEAEIDRSVKFCAFFQNMSDVRDLVSGATASAETSMFCWELTFNDRTKSFIYDVQQDFAEVGD